MQVPRLLGNERFKQALAPFFKENFPQAAIIEGAAGLGKKTAAFDIAQALMCAGEAPPCGRCGPCVRMQAGSHPDYRLFNPEGGPVKVDDIRQARRLSFIRPSEAAQKVFVVNDAGRMNVQAQNALLKVLEEPQQTVFLLLCQQAEQLLETVRSRCVRFRLDPLPEEEIRRQLEQRAPQASPEDRESAAARCGGSLGQALRRLEEGPGKTEELAARFIQALEQSELAALKVCLEAGALPREEFGRFCDESCLGLWELAKKNPEKGWALPVYDYLRRLRVRVEANASASAMSGALAAYCGGLLFAQS